MLLGGPRKGRCSQEFILGEEKGNIVRIKQGGEASHVTTAVGVAEELHDSKFRSLHMRLPQIPVISS